MRTVTHMFDKGHLLNNDDEEFNKQFQVAYGSWKAGNNSDILKQKLKHYISHGMQIGKIPRTTGFNMLLELSM